MPAPALTGRLLRALMPAPLWGLFMALAVLGSLALHGRLDERLPAILVLFASGGLLAFPIAALLAEGAVFVRGTRRFETRFAAHLLSLTLVTIAATAFLFAMQYRLFFEQWHGTRWSYGWAVHFVFTSASAVYQFIAMGVRLYMPFGLPMLLGMSLWLAGRNLPPAPARAFGTAGD